MTSGVTIIQFGLDLKVTKKLQFFKIFQAKISIFFIELPLTGKSWAVMQEVDLAQAPYPALMEDLPVAEAVAAEALSIQQAHRAATAPLGGS